MKLTTLLLIVSIMQVSASSFAQKVTLSEKNTPITTVLRQIKSQTGYDFIFTGSFLNNAKLVTITVKDAELKTVLSRVFEGQEVEFTIDEKSVVISKKEPSILDAAKHKVAGFFRQDSVTYRGRVTDEKGMPMPGASVLIKGSKRSTRTTPDGYFAIFGPRKVTLVFSYIGYGNQEVGVEASNALKPLKVVLSSASTNLEGVSIVSTGYQDIPKERATGSFEVITAKQLEHSTSPDLLKRLEGIATSIDFRNDVRPTNSSATAAREPRLNRLTIRGRNTLEYAGTENPSGRPLVVIDGVPSAYSIDQVNPEDVESITILKDAASASIWGSRAANGVIVIKTKQGGFNKKARVSFNSNLDVSEKIDFYYRPTMSIPDFIEAQRYAFNQQYPLEDYPEGTSPLGEISKNNAQRLQPPVFEILNSQRNGSITPDLANQQLANLGKNDLRKDYTKYFLQNPVIQQYNLAVDGGSNAVAYRFSAGYNHSLENTKKAGANRLSLAYNTSLKPFKNLLVNAGITYVNNTRNSQSDISNIFANYTQAPFYPYTALVDENGNPAVVPKGYRPGFLNLLQNSYGNKILNMQYKPLEDINETSLLTKTNTFNVNTRVNYKINQFLSADLAYNYSKVLLNSSDLVGENSYYMRDLVNRFTNPVTFNRTIPLGAQNITNSTVSDLHTLRGLLNVDKSWADNKHQIAAIAGFDVAQNYTESRLNQYYGYTKKNSMINTLLEYNISHPLLFANSDGQSTAIIPSLGSTFVDSKMRSYSLFSNVAYTYNQKYTLSGSVRKDASSQFGSGTNTGGTPFFSVGTAWNIGKESFYNLSWLPNFKLRTTYGYNGNTNAKVPANPLITYSSGNGINGLPFATPTNQFVTNSKLRPEITGMLNIGLDFGFKNNRISGSLEYYDKRTKDLIQTSNVDPTLGYKQLRYNAGNLHGYGVDLNLSSINLQTLNFSWSSNLLFSYNRVKVTKLYVPATKLSFVTVAEGGTNYTEGYDLSRIFAYRWMGLDPETGDPRVMLNGKVISITGSNNDDLANSPTSDLRYMGSALPVYYGSFRNTFNYKRLSVSFNLLYKLGYYSRRPLSDVVQYGSLFGQFDNVLQGAEYYNRWQQPGDERFTNVPSQQYSPGFTSIVRDDVYRQSDINVIKADHIRLQEINLSYQFKTEKGFLKNPRVYANVNNLGVIWRANKFGIDPDIFDYPNPRQYSIGFSTTF